MVSYLAAILANRRQAKAARADALTRCCALVEADHTPVEPAVAAAGLILASREHQSKAIVALHRVVADPGTPPAIAVRAAALLMGAR